MPKAKKAGRGMHMMPGGMMMSDKEMAKMMKFKRMPSSPMGKKKMMARKSVMK